MLKINGKLTVLLAYSGSVLSLGALLIYTILPSSELANGLQYSGTDALWVLAFSPVLALAGAACFTASLAKDYKTWQSFIAKDLITGALIATVVCLIASVAIYIYNFTTQFSLGFVAPFKGTVFETYAFILTLVTIDMFILSTFTAIAVKRNNK